MTFDKIYNFLNENALYIALIIVLLMVLNVIVALRVKSYKINFESNLNIKPLKIKKGHIVILPKLEKDGKQFVGWFYDKSLTQEANISIMPSQNITIYPKWTDLSENNELEASSIDLDELDESLSESEVNDGYVLRKSTNLVTKIKGTTDFNQNNILILANQILKYQKVTYRVTKRAIVFKHQGVILLKLTLSSSLLKSYFNLDLNSYDQIKYHFKDVSDKNLYHETPLLLNLRSERSIKYALYFIEELALKFSLKLKRKFEEYTLETLIYALKNAPLIKAKKSDLIVCKISAMETNKLADEDALSLVEKQYCEKVENIITISTEDLENNFLDTQTITLERLKEKGIIPIEADGFRLEAKGILTKAFYVVANDYSLTALKMILLTGGKLINLVNEK